MNLQQCIDKKPAFSDRACAIDYLRSFITAQVLFLHSILAYPTWGVFSPQNYSRDSTAPIIDPMKWKGFDLPPTLLNLYFMALMFFISGLFVWNSLKKKGVLFFLKDRFLRLGIPFVISLLVIMPIAYYPSFLMTGKKEDFFSYWMSWSWNSGPAWFISILFVYNMIIALIFMVLKSNVFKVQVPSVIFSKPSIFFLVLLVFSTLVFLPMFYLYGPFKWVQIGPVVIGQTCRIFHYFMYFLAGVMVGSFGLKNTFLVEQGSFSRAWLSWLISGFFSALLVLIFLSAMQIDFNQSWYPPKLGWLFVGISMEAYCAIFSMAFLAFFLRFFHARRGLIDNFCDNAYGIYLVHYPFIIWLQYALVDFTFPAYLKAIAVFVLSVCFSWGTSIILRSFPRVQQII